MMHTVDAASFSFVRIAAALIVLVMLAGSTLRPDAAAVAFTGDDAPLDLAAMALSPADLAAEGLDGFGLQVGSTRSPDAVASAFAFERGMPDDEALDLFETSGLEQAYELRLDLPGADPAAQSVRSTLQTYTDADGAAKAFTGLTDWEGVPTADVIEGDGVVGDESSLTRIEGTGVSPFHALDLEFRSGRIVAAVRVVDFTGDEPPPDVVEDLAGRLLDRIDAQLDRPDADLGRETLRLTGEGVTPIWDYYTAADDGHRSKAGDSPEEAANAAAEIADADITAEYEVSQRIATAGTPEGDTYFYGTVHRFTDADAAAAYLHDTPDRLANNEEFGDPAQIDGLQQYGDESATYSQRYYWEANAIDLVYETSLIRVDDRVGVVQLIAPDGAPLPALEALAAGQATCLNQGECGEPMTLPADLAAMVSGGGDGRVARMVRHMSAPLPSDGSFTGPSFGFELTWDPAVWEAVTNVSDDEADRLVLFENGTTSLVSLSAYATDHGADACIADLTAGLADDEAFGSARPMRDAAGAPVAVADPERAYAAFGLANDDGSHTFFYVECRTFAGGDANLLVTQVGDLDDYDARSTSREALLDDIILP